MICLYCKELFLSQNPGTCEHCEISHHQRPPVVGVNHISQVLEALDSLKAEEISLEDFDSIWASFYDLFVEFDNKWKISESSLQSRLSSGLVERFGPALEEIDESIQLLFQAIECLEAIPEEGLSAVDAAEEAVTRFFLGVCSNSALLLNRLEALQADNSGPGLLFDLPSA